MTENNNCKYVLFGESNACLSIFEDLSGLPVFVQQCNNNNNRYFSIKHKDLCFKTQDERSGTVEFFFHSLFEYMT